MTFALPTPLDLPLEWRISTELIDYDDAIKEMELRAKAIRNGEASELIWLLEHPPVYTGGTSAKPDDLLTPTNAIIRNTGRGGEWTYHGPGQRIVYILLDLSKRGQDIRQFVHQIEGWAIASLKALGIKTSRREGYPGVWCKNSPQMPPDKITAIGVRITKWVSWHGMAINHSPDLNAYQNLVPCGIHDGGITTITAHKPKASMDDLDTALIQNFAQNFPFE